MKAKILLFTLLLIAPRAFAQRVPIDLNIQLGVNTTLSSLTDYAENMKKLSEGAISLDAAYKRGSGSFTDLAAAGADLNKVIQGYNGAASAFTEALANTRFGFGLQFGFKPLNTKVITLALGASSGLRMGLLENVVFADQGTMIMFDVPIHAYVALEFLDFLRFDGLLGVVLSASSQDLQDFTAKPLEGAAKGAQLLDSAFNAPKFDMLLRTSLSMFYLELNGSINLEKPTEFSLFRVGVGVNLKVASLLQK
ncbi:hypothetical protein P0082_09615 [Candidatus Haliotispira prima]|uniref:Outer membrane protein beta-barrel domain-containing protein n=1 Tax=Candidatus Haliotispira prima TaxID=3034016 RepID=A0ABY8MFP7_9SPIO|nr:hypothetical protein P0082_09615 [Candidatus Haliotispira prima]